MPSRERPFRAAVTELSLQFRPDCREWAGRRPCAKQKSGLVEVCSNCGYYSPISGNVLIIEAGGLGSIIRTTVVSKEIKKRFPSLQTQWLTHGRGVELLSNVPSVDLALDDRVENLFILQAQGFDRLINFDHSPLFLALATTIKASERFGLRMSRLGKMVAAGPHAIELVRLQTDDHFRRRVNEKPIQQILLETAGFAWEGQMYDLVTNSEDDRRAQQLLLERDISPRRYSQIVGLNIGSSKRHDAKRWPAENFFQLAEACHTAHPDWAFIVLANPDDADIYGKIQVKQNTSPLDNIYLLGYRHTISQFISLVGQATVLVSADTFGAHVGIGLGKPVVILTGPQSEREIHTYGRGEKIHLGLECAPCFAARIDECMNPEKLHCMKGITVSEVKSAIEALLHSGAS